MKKAVYFMSVLAMAAVLTSCWGSGGNKSASDTRAAGSEDEGWISIFDGETFDGWRGYNKDTMPAAWTIDDGAIKINASGAGEAGARNGGDVIYTTKFGNFEFEFEWKVAPKANSGIFYLVQEIPDTPSYYSAPEYQILDNEGHPDGKMGIDGNRQSASLYDMIPAKPQNAKPVGEWNTGKILVFNGTVVHYQNGEQVLEYHLWTPEWKAMLDVSKFSEEKNPTAYQLLLNCGGDNKEGYIALQDHGDDVWYRNLRVKEL